MVAIVFVISIFRDFVVVFSLCLCVSVVNIMMKKIVSVLKHCRSFLITSHIGPDGDSISSQIALALLLEKLGKRKKVIIINEHTVPQIYRFLPHVNRVSAPYSLLPAPSSFEIAIVLDCSNLERTGKISSLISTPRSPLPTPLIINIDHHLDNSFFGDFNWVDKKASSVSEQIFSLSKILGLPLNKKLATLLYTGIITDTGSFQYHLSPTTHKIIATLISKGVVPEEITKNLYQNLPFASLKLFGLALATLKENKVPTAFLRKQEVGKDGKLCWMKVTREMYQETKSFIEDTEPFIDYLRQIKDVKVLFILKESSENKTKASFRSIGKFDVQKLAKKFGGGGHRNASGATLNEPIDQAEKTILKAIKLWMGY